MLAQQGKNIFYAEILGYHGGENVDRELHPEDGDDTFLRNVRNHPQGHMASQPR
jgi:hypothetical protein